MSRFVDKLKQISQAEHLPIGFRVERTASKQRLLLIARLSQTDIDNPAELVVGADAGLLPIDKPGLGAKVLEEIVQAVPDIPWGGWLDSISHNEIKQIDKTSLDFLFFQAAKMSLALLKAEKIGKILAVETSLDGGLIRAINELPADAVFVNICQKEGYFLTWQQLMNFQYFATLLNKPLLVPVPLNVDTNELQVLWELGVDGVVVETAPGQSAGGLKKLRKMIDGLTPPSKRKRTKVRAIVPLLREESAPVIDDEEEEE